MVQRMVLSTHALPGPLTTKLIEQALKTAKIVWVGNIVINLVYQNLLEIVIQVGIPYHELSSSVTHQTNKKNRLFKGNRMCINTI